jgi:hypothetical protein
MQITRGAMEMTEVRTQVRRCSRGAAAERNATWRKPSIELRGSALIIHIKAALVCFVQQNSNFSDDLKPPDPSRLKAYGMVNSIL